VSHEHREHPERDDDNTAPRSLRHEPGRMKIT